ncbi:Gfo/Idh/MocA family protein [Planctomycetota bacterium]
MEAPRIGIIGARRPRQGLGAFIAGFLRECGATVPAFIGTSNETIAEMTQNLKAAYGIEATGYTGFEAMLAEEKLDSLVIASPHQTHLDYLEKALAAGLHVLCEKPLVWNCDNPAAKTEEIVRGFQDRKLLLMENTQWPCTLETFRKLFPNAYGEDLPVTEFRMTLAPVSQGAAMILDAMSHVFSMLQELCPGRYRRLENIQIRVDDSGSENLVICFQYPSVTAVAVRVNLVHVPEPPRPAGYSINEHRARREINMEDYSMVLRDKGRAEPLPDPLKILVNRFYMQLINALSGAAPAPDIGITDRMYLLQQLFEHYENHRA